MASSIFGLGNSNSSSSRHCRSATALSPHASCSGSIGSTRSIMRRSMLVMNRAVTALLKRRRVERIRGRIGGGIPRNWRVVVDTHCAVAFHYQAPQLRLRRLSEPEKTPLVFDVRCRPVWCVWRWWASWILLLLLLLTSQLHCVFHVVFVIVLELAAEFFLLHWC